MSGYKINIQKYAAFLYTNKEIPERESKRKKKSLLKSHPPKKNLGKKPALASERLKC